MIESFLHFEQKYDLFNDKVFDFRYWPYIRRSVYNKITQDQEGYGQEKQLKNIGIKGFLKLIKRCIINNPLYYKEHKDVLFITHARRHKIDGRYKCIYTDDLANCFPDNSISAEFVYNLQHSAPIYTRNLLYLDVVDIFPVFIYFFSSIIYHKEVKHLEKKAKFIDNVLKEEFCYNIGDNIIQKWLVKRFVWHRVKRRILKKIIENIRPRVIVEVVSYEVNKMIINEIAAELGICKIELQHGPIVEGKLAYNYLTKTKYDFHPDKVLVFSDYWKRHCNLPIGQNNIIVTGFPYLEKEIKKYPYVDNSDGIPRILVLSQPAISKELLIFIRDCLRQAMEHKLKLRIMYKLHPDEYSKSSYIKEVLGEFKNIDIIDSSTISLYQLFSKSDIQIGVYSTAIYEGLSYNLTTWLYPAGGADLNGFMKGLLDNGIADLLKTSDDFVKKIEGWNGRGGIIKNNFFVNSATENIYNEIRKSFCTQ